jgi:hypothetical protein
LALHFSPFINYLIYLKMKIEMLRDVADDDDDEEEGEKVFC